MLRPKSKGSGIMVSHFVEERDGYLTLSDVQHAEALKVIKLSRRHVRVKKATGHVRRCYNS
jgi:hypothetical protein